MDLEKSFFFKMKALDLLITKWSFEIYPKCNKWCALSLVDRYFRFFLTIYFGKISKDTQFRNEGLRKVF